MKNHFFTFIVICSIFLVSFSQAEYRWDEASQQWVMIEAPVDESFDDGSGDVGGVDYDDDEDRVGDYGSGVPDDSGYDSDTSATHEVHNNNNKQPNNYNDYNDNSRNNNYSPDYNNRNNDQYAGGVAGNAGLDRDFEIVDGPGTGTGGTGSSNSDDFYSNSGNTGYGSQGGGNQGGNKGGKGTHGTPSSTSFFAKSGTMAAVIGGAVVGLLCAILCVMFVVYRMRKKDEGSYALDEPKRSPTANSYSKPPNREFYA